MFPARELERRIKEAFPDAQVQVQDLTGGQDHYRVEVVSSAFEGKPPVARHRLVYGLFDDVIGGDLHALSLATKTFDE
jgi:stress-induced morphogen